MGRGGRGRRPPGRRCPGPGSRRPPRRRSTRRSGGRPGSGARWPSGPGRTRWPGSGDSVPSPRPGARPRPRPAAPTPGRGRGPPPRTARWPSGRTGPPGAGRPRCRAARPGDDRCPRWPGPGRGRPPPARPTGRRHSGGRCPSTPPRPRSGGPTGPSRPGPAAPSRPGTYRGTGRPPQTGTRGRARPPRRPTPRSTGQTGAEAGVARPGSGGRGGPARRRRSGRPARRRTQEWPDRRRQDRRLQMLDRPIQLCRPGLWRAPSERMPGPCLSGHGQRRPSWSLSRWPSESCTDLRRRVYHGHRQRSATDSDCSPSHRANSASTTISVVKLHGSYDSILKDSVNRV